MTGTDRNPIDAALATFLESPVMIIVGSCDDGLLPQVARAAGVVVDRAKGRVDLIVSGWQWPQTIANVGRNGQLAVTFARPADYVSYQLKGRAAIIPASAAHRRPRTALHRGDDRDVSRGSASIRRSRRPGSSTWSRSLAPRGRDDFRADAGEKAGSILEPSRWTIRLRDLQACFEGVIPSIIATASQDGVPNISYLSHVALVDDEHVALSDQFFSKTAANIRANNNAAVMLVDPRDGGQYGCP